MSKEKDGEEAVEEVTSEMIHKKIGQLLDEGKNGFEIFKVIGPLLEALPNYEEIKKRNQEEFEREMKELTERS